MKKESIREKSINTEIHSVIENQKKEMIENILLTDEIDAVWEDINRKHIYLLSRVATNKFQTK